MAIPTTPAVASRPPWKNISPLRGTPVQLVTNVTNTATSATQITGLTTSFYIDRLVSGIILKLQVDNFTNSSTNNVIITAWIGTVGTGTQVGQFTLGAQSASANPGDLSFFIPASALTLGASTTFNVGMHGSGAGTNTLVCGSTNPCNFYALAI
jgi:hypothetical protein